MQSPRTTESTVLYDRLTGNLSFDADGTGSAQAVLFARLSTNLSLTKDDFVRPYEAQAGTTVRVAEGPYVAPAGVANIYSDAPGAITITGNALDNFIKGANGSDTLFGGAGNDTLLGGEGADTLRGGLGFDSLYGGANADRFEFFRGDGDLDYIYDFQPGADKIALSGFGGTATFALRQGTGVQTPTTAEGTFLYDKTTGYLSYDADGSGGAQAVLFARLSPDLTLQTTDFLFFTP